MNSITVGIGEFKVSDEPGAVLKTFALGSCVAVLMYDSVRRIAGMIHIALPESSIDLVKAGAMPGYFADTGLPLFLNMMLRTGALNASSWIKVAGGANVINEQFRFDIGRRNLLAVKKILWGYNMGPIAHDVGGNISRTVHISVDTGDVRIISQGNEWQL